MKTGSPISLLALLFAALFLTNAARPASGGGPPAPPIRSAADLTGVWQADDGATYYVRQAGQEVWWYGQGANFANVFHGKMNSEDGFGGRWADVPVKKANAYGNLSLKIVGSDQFVQAGTQTNFRAKVWNRAGGDGGANQPGGSTSGVNADSGAAAGEAQDMGTIDWDVSVSHFDGMREQAGKFFTFTCPDTGKVRQIAGSNPNYNATYTSICSAAAHSGVAGFALNPDGTVKSGGRVTIQIGGPAEHVKGTPGANGLKSIDDPGTKFTYRIVQ